jgi:hypothetical protein
MKSFVQSLYRYLLDQAIEDGIAKHAIDFRIGLDEVRQRRE